MDGTHIAQFDSTTGLRLASNDSIDNIGYRCWAEEGPFIDPYVVNGTQYYSYFAPVNACRARGLYSAAFSSSKLPPASPCICPQRTGQSKPVGKCKCFVPRRGEREWLRSMFSGTLRMRAVQ